MMIRAFIAVQIDKSVLQRIVAAIDELKNRISDIRWTPQSNCHLTLKFLGNIDETRVESIGRALERALSPFPRCTINAKGLGVFPDARRPRILWVGIEGNSLAALAERIDTALAALGFERENKNFTPHLTIGRRRQSKRSDKDLRETLEKWKDRDFGGSTIDEVILFQSILNPGGADHRRLKAVQLGDESAIA